MDTLPIELLERICALASCDGGRTSGSLRLVSRALCAVSETYRFNTVAIAGGKQILSFRDAFRHSRVSARHLFIAVYDEPGMGISDAVEEIIRRASATLETLTCLLEDIFDESIYILLLSTSFPYLNRLSFRHPRVANYRVMQPDSKNVLFPRLRSLHVAYTTPCSIFTAHGGLSGFISRSGNYLDRVRVSVVAFDGRGVDLTDDIDITRTILGLAPGDATVHRQRVRALPATVKSYVLEPWSPPKVYMGWMEGGSIRDELDKLTKETNERERTDLIILPSIIHEMGRLGFKSVEEWKAEWLLIQSGELDPLFEWSEDAAMRPCRGMQPEQAPSAPTRYAANILDRLQVRTTALRG